MGKSRAQKEQRKKLIKEKRGGSGHGPQKEKKGKKKGLLATYGKTIGLVLALALAMAVALADGLWVRHREPPKLEWHGPCNITTKRSYNPQEFGLLSVSWFAHGPGHYVAPWGERSVPCAAMACAFDWHWLWRTLWLLGPWLQLQLGPHDGLNFWLRLFFGLFRAPKNVKKVCQCRWVGNRRYSHPKGRLVIWHGIPFVSSTRMGLNSLCRGGAGGSQATARKRVEGQHEKGLLQALSDVLAQFSSVETQDKPVASDETQLLQTLKRIIKRSENKPGTLLQRLRSVVSAAESNHSVGKKVKRSVDSNKEKASHGAAAVRSQPSVAAESKQKPTRTVRFKEPVEESWVEVVNRKRTSSSKKPAAPNVAAKKSGNVALQSAAWSAGSVHTVSHLTRTLENGQAPTCGVVLCGDHKQVDNLRRLASVHQVPDSVQLAVVLPCPPVVVTTPDGAKEVKVPLVRDNRVTWRVAGFGRCARTCLTCPKRRSKSLRRSLTLRILRFFGFMCLRLWCRLSNGMLLWPILALCLTALAMWFIPRLAGVKLKMPEIGSLKVMSGVKLHLGKPLPRLAVKKVFS